jgi:MFS family permease
MIFKLLLVFFILLPLGLLMGIPFPAGLKILGESYEPLIPWAWAINGCLSVLAPLLAIMLAMVVGFRSVLWAGAGAYLLAFLTYFFLPPRSSEQKPHPPSVQY